MSPHLRGWMAIWVIVLCFVSVLWWTACSSDDDRYRVVDGTCESPTTTVTSIG